MVIKVSTTISVEGGPLITVATDLDVDAYDFIEKEIAAGENTTVPIQPEAAANVSLLFIKASPYPETTADLTYQATESDGLALTPAASEYELDQAHLYSGSAVSAVASSPQFLKFTNGSADDVTISVLVGRAAG